MKSLVATLVLVTAAGLSSARMLAVGTHGAKTADRLPSASADTAFAGPQSVLGRKFEVAMMPAAMAAAGTEAPPAHPQGAPGGMPGYRHHAVEVAVLLNAMETGIGIGDDQREVWRRYAEALQAVLAPPSHSRAPRSDSNDMSREAFASSLALAAGLIEQGHRAETLVAAIAELRDRLTPDQLSRARLLESMVPEPPHGVGAPPVALPPPEAFPPQN